MTWLRTSHLLHHLVLEWSRIAVPVLVFHDSRAAGLRENMVFQHLENVSRTLNSKCFPTLSTVCEKRMTLRILGKKNMTWRNPASFTDAPSLIAARRWFGCIPYSTARHWISLWASSSAFMLLARISNLRSLCCIFQSLSMKRTIIANASPSLVLPIKDHRKSAVCIMKYGAVRKSCRNGRKLSTFKGEYLPSVELPQADIDRASCLQVMWILLLPK